MKKEMAFIEYLEILVIVIAAVAIFGFIVEHLWNWLIPAIFGWHAINFWQAVGILLLSKILFGGFRGRGGNALAAPHGTTMGKDVSRRTGKIRPRHARPLWLSRLSTRRAEGLRHVMKFDAPAIAMQIVEELERENARLQKLVAELLARNQQLRQALESQPDDLLSPTRDSCYSGTPLRTRHTALLALTLIAAASFAQAPVTSPETSQEKLPLWAYPGHFSPAPSSAGTRAEVEHLPGSKATYTKGEIGDLFVVPDWYPDIHPPMPDIVAHGRKPDVYACGHCHLPNGQGRPENASVTGLSAEYIVQQMADFKSGLRKGSDPGCSPSPTW